MKPVLYALGAVTLAAAVLFGLWRWEVAAHSNTRDALSASQTKASQWQERAATQSAILDREREQCATDLAGEIARGQDEAEKARRAGEAIASLTTACVQTQGPAATNRALRKIYGEVER